MLYDVDMGSAAEEDGMGLYGVPRNQATNLTESREFLLAG